MSERQVQRSISKLKQLNYLVVLFKKNKRYIYTYFGKKTQERNIQNNLNIFHYNWLEDKE